MLLLRSEIFVRNKRYCIANGISVVIKMLHKDFPPFPFQNLIYIIMKFLCKETNRPLLKSQEVINLCLLISISKIVFRAKKKKILYKQRELNRYNIEILILYVLHYSPDKHLLLKRKKGVCMHAFSLSIVRYSSPFAFILTYPPCSIAIKYYILFMVT